MAKKLFIGGLSWDTTDSALSGFFAKVGNVISAVIITDRATGRSKGFGFVEMSTEEEAEKAKQELNGQTLDGRTISVSDARPMQPRTNNYGGGGNYQKRDDRNRSGGGGGYRDRDSRRGGRY